MAGELKLTCVVGDYHVCRDLSLKITSRHNPHGKYAIAAVGSGVSLIVSYAVGARLLSKPPYRSFGSLLYRFPMPE